MPSVKFPDADSVFTHDEAEAQEQVAHVPTVTFAMQARHECV